MKVCVTGAAGFIGSAFVRQLLARAGSEVVAFDALTYAGNLENLEECRADPNCSFVKGSVTDAAAVSAALEGCDAVVNFAAESHVDRGIGQPEPFISTNIGGAAVLAEAAAAAGLRMVQVSTDEVYGSIEAPARTDEQAPLRPSSTYAASKATADIIVLAAFRLGLDLVITRCGNNYGPRQFPEKLVPLFITNAFADQPLPLYGDGLNVRDWIHVDDHCRAIDLVLRRGRSGEVYNVGARGDRSNMDVCRAILGAAGKPESLISPVNDRPGHDRRYALDASRIADELGWAPMVGFEEGLAATVEWYAENRAWWERIKTGEYLEFYERLYGERLADGGEV